MRTDKSKHIRIISTKNLIDEFKNILTKENGCYLSSDRRYLLITDIGKFQSLRNIKYASNSDKKYTIQLNKVGYWTKIKYKNKYSNFFNQKIYLADFSESTEEICEQWFEDGTIFTNEWDELIDNYLKLCVIIKLIEQFEIDTNILSNIDNVEIERILQDMEDSGYDSNILRNEIERIFKEGKQF